MAAATACCFMASSAAEDMADIAPSFHLICSSLGLPEVAVEEHAEEDQRQHAKEEHAMASY